jgi:cytochrome c-type biogenesis protein CcmH/NrfG
MMVTRRGVVGVLVTLLFLGCAAGPNSGGIAPESGTAAERNRAAMERPADPVAYLHLARAHYHAEAAEWPQAVAELRLAIDRDPKSATLWHLLARWLERQGAHAEAVTAAKEAIALDPQSAGAYLTLAEAYTQKNETEATAPSSKPSS